MPNWIFVAVIEFHKSQSAYVYPPLDLVFPYFFIFPVLRFSYTNEFCRFLDAIPPSCIRSAYTSCPIMGLHSDRRLFAYCWRDVLCIACVSLVWCLIQVFLLQFVSLILFSSRLFVDSFCACLFVRYHLSVTYVNTDSQNVNMCFNLPVKRGLFLFLFHHSCYLFLL